MAEQDRFNEEMMRRRRSSTPVDEGFIEDEEWSSPVTKILKLPFDHESWQHAQEIMEAPSPLCRKVGDEARSIAARHIIDRLKEENLLSRIHKVAPRLRSAVELLSKPDGDYVYPKFQFVVNELRFKWPEVYTSVIDTVGLEIPGDMKPSTMLVSLAKSTVENADGELEMNWGKFVTLLGLAGALAVDSVKADYPDGVAEVVEAFGLLVEQALGEWILSESGGGGWEGFIKLNEYKARLPPVPRTMLILFCALIAFYFVYRFFLAPIYNYYIFLFTPVVELSFWEKYPQAYCLSGNDTCPNIRTPLEFLYHLHCDDITTGLELIN